MVEYGRTVRLLLGKQGEPGQEFVTKAPLGRQPEGHRIDFSISGGANGQPRKAIIELYNPPPDLGGKMLAAGELGFVSLAAGHGDIAPPWFSGVPIRDGVTASRRSDGSIVLRVEALSGGSRLRRAVVSASWGGPVSVATVVARLAVLSGHKVGRSDIPSGAAFPRGYAFTGPAHRAFSEIASGEGMLCHYHGTAVEFLDPSVDPSTTTASKFSEKNGTLVRPPSKTDQGLTFQGLLGQTITPGRQVVVEYYDWLSRREVRHRLIVRDFSVTGSTHGTEFHVTATGRRV